VAEQIHAVKHWDFGIPVILEPTTLFIDPPYQHNYKYRQPDQNYKFLAEYAKTMGRLHQVIVCEALGKNGEVPDWLPFRESHRSVTSRRKATQSHHSRELIWTSDDLARRSGV
jgi:site-specific DNA-adenine methylase